MAAAPANTTLALFGQGTDGPFSMAEATAKFQEGEAQLIQYLRRYFAKTSVPIGFAMHDPGRPPALIIPTLLSHFVGGKADKLSRIGADNKPQHVSPHKVISSFELVKCEVDPTKPPVYEEKKQTCINLFGGWLHPLTVGKPTAAELRLIKPQLDHIRNIWAAKDETMYQLLLRWFARIAQLGKNQIGLYLKGPEGLGKSIIFDLMREHVFGENACLSTDKASIITGGFNAGLMGRALLVLEEMPTATEGQYRELTNSLKVICTGATLEATKKHHDSLTIRNTISVAVLSNRNALALQAGDRRWAELDLDDSKKGDLRYFESIGLQALSEVKKKEWGLAMWKYLRSIDLTKHTDRQAPMTEAKAAHTMPAAVQFIKQTILETNPIQPRVLRQLEKQPFSQFYAEFKKWWQDNFRSNAPCPKSFSQQLKLVTCIDRKPARFGGNPVPAVHGASRQELIKEFLKNKWIDREIDDIPDLEEDGTAGGKDRKAPAPEAKDVKTTGVKPPSPSAQSKNAASAQSKNAAGAQTAAARAPVTATLAAARGVKKEFLAKKKAEEAEDLIAAIYG